MLTDDQVRAELERINDGRFATLWDILIEKHGKFGTFLGADTQYAMFRLLAESQKALGECKQAIMDYIDGRIGIDEIQTLFVRIAKITGRL